MPDTLPHKIAADERLKFLPLFPKPFADEMGAKTHP
jgi:hypothetical protein